MMKFVKKIACNSSFKSQTRLCDTWDQEQECETYCTKYMSCGMSEKSHFEKTVDQGDRKLEGSKKTHESSKNATNVTYNNVVKGVPTFVCG